MTFAIAFLCAAALLPPSSIAAADEPAVAERPAPPVFRPARAEGPEPSDVQDLVFLGGSRPVFLRLHLRVNGRSHRAAWRDFIDDLFDEADADGDEVISAAEIEALPNADQLEQTGLVARLAGSGVLPFGRGRVPDGAIRSQLAEHYRRLGLAPFLARSNMPNSMQGRFARAISEASQNAPAAELIEQLDRDGDGKLAPEDFRAALGALRKLDLDEDETIGAGELQPLQNPFVQQESANVANAAPPALFLPLSDGDPPDQAIRQLLQKYDIPSSDGSGNGSRKFKNGKLSRAETAFPEERFAPYDGDGDGELDQDELQRLLRDPPVQLELTVRVGAREPNESAVTAITHDPSLKADVRTAPGGQMNIVLDGVQWEFAIESGASLDVNQFYVQQFKTADANNNAYLEESEAQSNFYFQSSFAQMDRDGNKMLFEDEVSAYIGRQTAAAQSRTLLTVSDQGRNLFEILDQNRDRRLSGREFLAAAERLHAWDADGDGRVAQAEVPTHYRLSLERGKPGFQGIPVVSESVGGGAPERTAIGPHWFRRMDRNRDGDLARSEFLGPLDRFDRMDANADGWIDPDEAAAAK